MKLSGEGSPLDLVISRSSILSEWDGLIILLVTAVARGRGRHTGDASYILSEDPISSRGEWLLIEVFFLKMLYRPGLGLAVELDIELEWEGWRIMDMFGTCDAADQVSV